MHVEGIWADNEHTAKGTILHTHADERGYEIIGKAKLLRALPYSTCLPKLSDENERKNLLTDFGL